ncbi:MAG: ABC transporter permease, partial [Ilumatobacteraceae bacterium]
MSGFVAGVERQAVILRRLPDYLTFIAISPLSTLAFLAIVRSVGREDLSATALIGVSIITTWQTGLFVAGDTLALDRQFGLLELNLAAPISVRRFLIGRVVVSTTFSFIPFIVNIAVARLVFGPDVANVADPGRFVVVGVMMWFAMLGALLCMSSIFVMSGRSTALGNGLSYPLFLLAGVVVPVTYLPTWVQPISALIFMRWSAEGFRLAAAGSPESIVPGLVANLVLGVVMLGVGTILL